MKTERSRVQIAGWVFFGLAVALLFVQAVSLYNRGSKGESDVGVFYRTALLMREGAGGEIYAQRDSVTGWPISIPPAGMALFQPFAMLGPEGSTFAWALFNVLVALVAVFVLKRTLEAQGDELFVRSFPWLAGMFLVLAGGSMQVGQFSLLFVACWVIAIYASSTNKVGLQALMWALPSAIKLYPALLFASPFSVPTDKRSKVVLAGWFALSLAVVVLIVPYLFYGSRTWDLNASFFNEIVLDPSGRLKWMQALGSTANQSLDSVLIRYLSWYPKFHEEYPYIPTAHLDLDAVRMLGHVARAIIVAFTVAAVVKCRRRCAPSALDMLLMAALWSSTLYAILPETRARYAVYAFLGFVPLVLIAQKKGWRHAVLVSAVFLLVMGAIPKPLEVWGVGYVGTFALWVANLLLVRGGRPRPSTEAGS